MATITITAQNFENQVVRDGIILVDWWAPWCGPCRSFGPVFEAASEKHTDLTFAKVNTDEEQQLAGEFQIQSIPTLMAFRDRVLLYMQPGALPPAALEDLIQQIRTLDMDEIRQKIAASAKPAEAAGEGQPET